MNHEATQFAAYRTPRTLPIGWRLHVNDAPRRTHHRFQPAPWMLVVAVGLAVLWTGLALWAMWR